MKDEKLYKAIVWVGDKSGERVSIKAIDGVNAKALLKKKFGEEAKITLWNEEDATAPR